MEFKLRSEPQLATVSSKLLILTGCAGTVLPSIDPSDYLSVHVPSVCGIRTLEGPTAIP
jgi:hypothetical protein